MNRLIWRYGAWVSEQARASDLPVLDPLPFTTLPHRARAVLAPEAEAARFTPRTADR